MSTGSRLGDLRVASRALDAEVKRLKAEIEKAKTDAVRKEDAMRPKLAYMRHKADVSEKRRTRSLAEKEAERRRQEQLLRIASGQAPPPEDVVYELRARAFAALSSGGAAGLLSGASSVASRDSRRSSTVDGSRLHSGHSSWRADPTPHGQPPHFHHQDYEQQALHGPTPEQQSSHLQQQ